MKKLVYGLAAVALAVGGVAATKAKSAKAFISYYWQYTTTAHTALIYPVNAIPTQSNPDLSCTGLTDNCVTEFAAYTKVATKLGSANFYYEPKGTNVAVFKTQP